MKIIHVDKSHALATGSFIIFSYIIYLSDSSQKTHVQSKLTTDIQPSHYHSHLIYAVINVPALPLTAWEALSMDVISTLPVGTFSR